MITNPNKYIRVVFLDEENEAIIDHYISIMIQEGICVVEHPINGGVKQKYMSSWLNSVDSVKRILQDRDVPSSKIAVFGHWSGKSNTLLTIEKENIDSGSLSEDHIQLFDFVYEISFDDFKGNSEWFKPTYVSQSSSNKQKISNTFIDKSLQQELDNFKNLVQQIYSITKTL